MVWEVTRGLLLAGSSDQKENLGGLGVGGGAGLFHFFNRELYIYDLALFLNACFSKKFFVVVFLSFFFLFYSVVSVAGEQNSLFFFWQGCQTDGKKTVSDIVRLDFTEECDKASYVLVNKMDKCGWVTV